VTAPTDKQRRLIRELEQELGRQPGPIPGSRRKAATRIDSLLAEKRRWAARSDRRRRKARQHRASHRDREAWRENADWMTPEEFAITEDAMSKRRPA
jgi:hypothetical protein